MKRRGFLRLGTALVAFVLTGHGSTVMAAGNSRSLPGLLLVDLEPDGMEPVFRRYRLLVVGQRDSKTASAFAEATVDVLARFLPASRPRLARAADTRRVGVLIGTRQQDVAIMTVESAEALFLAKSPFDDIREVQLRLIVSFGSHVLVCRTDFVDHHAYLLTQALVEHEDMLPAPAVAPSGVVPAHNGSHAYFAGQEMPGD
jgi:hypothetical protein